MMMMMHKKLRCCYTVPSSCFSLTALCSSRSTLLLPYSTASTKRLSSEDPPFFIGYYLIKSCGFSLEKASKALKFIHHVKSPTKADSVLHFLRQSGFNDTQIRDLISRKPRLLCANVEKTLKAMFTVLQDLGFSEPDLIQLVSKNPDALLRRDLRPKIQFFRSLLGTNDNLRKAFSRDTYLLTASLDKRLAPNISFLRELGIPDSQIAKIVTEGSKLIGRNPSSVEAIIRRADKFGVCCRSEMFWHVVQSVSTTSRAKIDGKFKLLRSLGLSEVEIVSASRKQPKILKLSQDNIRRKMKFLIMEVGCELSYIACHPQLLAYSMEKRLIPRWYVLSALKREDLLERRYDIYNVMNKKENQFLKKFVLPNKEKVLGLHEAYVAACSGKASNI